MQKLDRRSSISSISTPVQRIKTPLCTIEPVVLTIHRDLTESAVLLDREFLRSWFLGSSRVATKPRREVLVAGHRRLFALQLDNFVSPPPASPRPQLAPRHPPAVGLHSSSISSPHLRFSPFLDSSSSLASILASFVFFLLPVDPFPSPRRSILALPTS